MPTIRTYIVVICGMRTGNVVSVSPITGNFVQSFANFPVTTRTPDETPSNGERNASSEVPLKAENSVPNRGKGSTNTDEN